MGLLFVVLDIMMAKRHMSLNDLADNVGISNVNLSKIKNNKVNAIRFSTLAGICNALECEPGDILKYDPNAEGDDNDNTDN
nr:helix-turn-helix transcriptional regulator [Butyrivibrio proteoclasticus]